MGNRAVVIFYSGESAAPGIYLHWHGSAVKDWLPELREIMRGRDGDEGYAAARFAALACSKVDGNLSVGLLNTPAKVAKVGAGESRGDAGIFLVDCAAWTVRNIGGHPGETDWPAIHANGPVSIA